MPAALYSYMPRAEWVAWIPLAILVAVFFRRLLYAPYALYKEMESERDSYRKIASGRIDKKQICDDLSGFMNELNALKGMCRKNKGVAEELKTRDNELSGRIKNYLTSQEGLGSHFLARYRSDAGIQMANMDFQAGAYHKKLYHRIYWQVIRMEQFINEFSH